MAGRKAKKRNLRKNTTTRKNTNAFALYQMENPLAELSHDEYTSALMELGKSYELDFIQTLTELKKSIYLVNPLQLMSMLAVYKLFVGISDTGERSKDDNEFGQAHVELAQALLLQNELTAYQLINPDPSIVPGIIGQLSAASKAYALKRFQEAGKEERLEWKAQKTLQEKLRLNTQAVRNWGYYKYVVNTVLELYGKLDNNFINSVGFSASGLINIFSFLVRHTETKVNNFMALIRPALGATSIADCVDAYYANIPGLVGDQKELIDFLKEHNANLEQAKSLILSHCDLRLPELFTFTVDLLCKDIGLSSSEITAALSMVSLSFGELHDYDSELFFLDNPMWLKPVIRLSDDSYFCAIPQAFFSFSLRIFNHLVSNNTQLKRICMVRKAEFLEAAAKETLSLGFPGCQASPNIVWREGSTEYETDLIVKIDSYLLIVEAKSGSISPPALRGAPDRMRKHIEELLINPALQSYRLAKKIERNIAGDEDDKYLKSQLSFPIDSIKQIIRISITLEDFAAIQSNIAGLEETGWLPNGMPFAPTFCLSDLAVVFDILSSTHQRIHYLVRRAELERNLVYTGDELDLLGLYLETGFNLGEIEFSGDHVFLTGLDKKISDYYIARDQGIPREKPLLKATHLWSDISRFLEERQFDRWSEAAIMLLNVSHNDQLVLEKKFSRLKKRARKIFHTTNYMNSLVLEPPEWRKDAIVLHVFRDRERQQRREKIENAANLAFSAGHVSRCLVISQNIDSDDYPYSLLAVFNRKPSGVN